MTYGKRQVFSMIEFQAYNTLQGWQDPQVDKFFDKLRNKSDHPNKKKRNDFYEQNKKVGKQLVKIGAFSVLRNGEAQCQALNLCMAPGGYTWSILRDNPSVQIRGITLPPEIGGHPMLLPEDPRVNVKFMDITMMASELANSGAPIDQRHPECEKFNVQVPYEDLKFQIVLCDGQTLRTHERGACRQELEPLRLTVSQLIFGMRRIHAGGTFIILLHRVDSWNSIEMLQTFERFSSIQLFKPKWIWEQRSSFYLIARDVQPSHPAAIDAVKKWRDDWWQATFGGESGTGEDLKVDESDISSVITTMSTSLRDMIRPIWEIQLIAMKGDLEKKTSNAGLKRGFRAGE
jgi:hypothetical protein